MVNAWLWYLMHDFFLILKSYNGSVVPWWNYITQSFWPLQLVLPFKLRDFCFSPPSSLSQYGIFTAGVKIGITVLKYCIYILFITLIMQKERSDDLRLTIWVPKCSELNPLNCTGPYLLPIKAWHEWGIKWHLLKLRISCSERSGDHKRSE